MSQRRPESNPGNKPQREVMAMASKDAEKAAAQARADRRQAERDQRMATGKAVKIPPPVSWRRSTSRSN